MANYYSGLLPDFWRRYDQRKALTGRSLTSGEISALSEPMLSEDYQKAVAAGEREQRQRELDRQYELNKKQLADQKSGATASGLIQTAGLGASLYLSNKYLGLLKAGGGAAGGAAGAGVTTAGAAGGGLVPAAAPAVAAPSAIAGESAVAAAAPGAGLASSAGYGLLGGGIGYGISKAIGAGKDTTEALTLGGAGAGIGGAIAAGTAIGGPAGAVLGGIIGVGASFLDDASVICTYCMEKGYISKLRYVAASRAVSKNIGVDVYWGYRTLGDKIVSLASRSRFWNWIARKVGVAMSGQLAHMEYPSRYRKNRLGGAIILMGSPICRWLFNHRHPVKGECHGII